MAMKTPRMRGRRRRTRRGGGAQGRMAEAGTQFERRTSAFSEGRERGGGERMQQRFGGRGGNGGVSTGQILRSLAAPATILVASLIARRAARNMHLGEFASHPMRSFMHMRQRRHGTADRLMHTMNPPNLMLGTLIASAAALISMWARRDQHHHWAYD